MDNNHHKQITSTVSQDGNLSQIGNRGLMSIEGLEERSGWLVLNQTQPQSKIIQRFYGRWGGIGHG